MNIDVIFLYCTVIINNYLSEVTSFPDPKGDYFKTFCCTTLDFSIKLSNAVLIFLYTTYLGLQKDQKYIWKSLYHEQQLCECTTLAILPDQNKHQMYEQILSHQHRLHGKSW